jgi:hypothetical protein
MMGERGTRAHGIARFIGFVTFFVAIPVFAPFVIWGAFKAGITCVDGGKSFLPDRHEVITETMRLCASGTPWLYPLAPLLSWVLVAGFGAVLILSRRFRRPWSFVLAATLLFLAIPLPYAWLLSVTGSWY